MRHVTLLALLALAPVVPAQITEAQAVKQARAASKAALADLKSAIGQARDAFLLDVTAVEGKFEAGNGLLSDLDGLFDSASALQVAVQQAAYSADQAVAQGVQAALAAFADGSELKGLYPDQLQLGRSGVIDDANVLIDKLLAKTYAALNRRLLKTEAVVAAGSFVRLRAELRPPYGSLPLAVSEDASLCLEAGLGIDILWAQRDTALGTAGQLHVAGTDAHSPLGHAPDFVASDEAMNTFKVAAADAPPFDTGRWTASIASLPRGSYIGVVRMHDQLEAPYRSASFGMP